MAKKPYGDRWRLTDGPQLGQGGQGQVFRVIDIRGEQAGELALKRVLNPHRNSRFHAEIDAIARLKHPNIIPLIDHSAFETDVQEKAYLVMPLAAGGDLSKEGRLGLYKGSIDSVVRIAQQLSSALEAAHTAGIVHRDVKPQNVLFTGHGHDLWLSDFGICLIGDRPRFTENDEVVGPRAFMAPELEDGGQLAVTPAADIYSLGKVIHFAISGGEVIPRERLQESRYRDAYAAGERHQLLYLLLQQMICPLPSRLTTMAEVGRRLASIADWESKARTPALNARAQGALNRLNQSVLDLQRHQTLEADVRAQEEATRSAVLRSVGSWLQAHLSEIAQVLSDGPNTAVVRPLDVEALQLQRSSVGGRLRGGVEMVLRMPTKSSVDYTLLLLVTETTQASVVFRHAGEPIPTPKAVDPTFRLCAYYRPLYQQGHFSGTPTQGFLTKPKMVGTQATFPHPTQQGRLFKDASVPRLSVSFVPTYGWRADFRASEWPGVEEKVRDEIGGAVEAFVGVLTDAWPRVGP